MLRLIVTASMVFITQSGALGQVDLLRRADSLSSIFAYPAAIQAYRQVNPIQASALYGLSTAENMLGLDYLAAGVKDSARVHFEQSVDAAEAMRTHFPDDPRTYFSLGASYGNLALLRGGKTKVQLGRDVEQYARHAVELDSTYSDALALLGTFYREVAKLSWIERFVATTLFGGLPKGSLDKSLYYLERAVRCDSASTFATFELGQTFIEMDRFEEARKVFERLATLSPRNSENARDMKEAARWLGSRTAD